MITFMKRILTAIILFAVCLLCYSQQKPLTLGSTVENLEKSQSRVLIPNNDLVESHDVMVDGVNYTIGIRDGKIVYIGTSDERFTVDNLQVGALISRDLLGRELGYTPGWGYYIKMDSGWYAGLDFSKKPTEGTPIQFFFKYDF